MNEPLDIHALKGMTPAIERALRKLGIHTTADVLRARRRVVVQAISPLSAEQLRDWHAFAQMLEVRGMTPALCAALQRRGIGTLDELLRQSFTQLRAVVAASPARVRATLTDDDLVAMLTDAVHLRHGGILNGSVTDAAGDPVEGAVARCMGREATSNERGRFRLTRLPLATPLTLGLFHPSFGAKSLGGVQAVPLTALVGRRVAFGKRASHPRSLSALQGDVLPPFGTAPVRMRAESGTPDRHDILRFVEFYASGEIRAVSRFFDFADGQFVSRLYRLAKSEVAANAKPGCDLVFHGTKWKKASFTARDIERRRRVRALTASWPAKPASASDLKKKTRELLAAMSG